MEVIVEILVLIVTIMVVFITTIMLVSVAHWHSAR